MKIIQKLGITPMEEANAQLAEVENQIEKRLRGVFESLEIERTVGVTFSRQGFCMKIYINDREYEISVQGRGGDINKYLDRMIEILREEAKQ